MHRVVILGTIGLQHHRSDRPLLATRTPPSLKPLVLTDDSCHPETLHPTS